MEPLHELDFRYYLRRELSERQSKNPRYSLRAFARDLEMSNQKLSQILKGKTGLSLHAANGVADRLQLEHRDRELFLSLVQLRHARASQNREEAEKKLNRLMTALAFKDMPVERFSPFLHWESISIYMMAEREDFQPDPALLAKRLGISTVAAERILQDLLASGLIRQDEGGRWHPQDASVHMRIKSSFEEIRAYYKDLLEKSMESLDTQTPEQRHNSAAICNVSEEDMEFAKKEIDAFRQKLVRDLSMRQSKDPKIYCLAVQLFQLEKPT